jgi:hypothetical protein
VGCEKGIRWPARSRTRRPQTMEMERSMAPRKSMRFSLETCEDLGRVQELGTDSFQATSVRANIVGGHCPRNDLIILSVVVRRTKQSVCIPSPSDCVCEVSANWSSETSSCCCRYVHVASP